MTVPEPAGSRQRTRLPRGQRRALLLEAALSAFSEQGYHQTAMDDIAERAGVSKPVLYQHFDSKLDLYLAIAGRVRTEVVETVEDALASTHDNAERISATIDAYFEFVDRPGSGYPLIMASDMGSEPAVAAVLEQVQQACAEAVGRVIQEETGLAWSECVLLGAALVGQVQSAARHWYESSSELPRQQAAELVRTVVWRGIGFMPRIDGDQGDGTGDGADRPSG